MKLPNKPIEKVYIEFKRDPSVGIFSSTYTAEIYIDLNVFGFDSEAEAWAYLNSVREHFFHLYFLLEGGEFKPHVLFDFEAESEDEADNEALDN